MSENSENVPTPMLVPEAIPEIIIALMKDRLDQKTQVIRVLEDSDIQKTAILNTLIAQNEALTNENRVLRKRLGLEESGPIDLTEIDSSIAET